MHILVAGFAHTPSLHTAFFPHLRTHLRRQVRGAGGGAFPPGVAHVLRPAALAVQEPCPDARGPGGPARQRQLCRDGAAPTAGDVCIVVDCGGVG